MGMNLVVTLPGLPYALRVEVPEENQEQAQQWLYASENHSVQFNVPFTLKDRQSVVSRLSARNHATLNLAEQATQVRAWLHPLLESHGFVIELDGEDERTTIYFEHETIWQRRNPKAIIKDLATLQSELQNIEFDGTIAGLIEILKEFPGGWKLPVNKITAVGNNQAVLKKESATEKRDRELC